jgi:DNA-directed RNA polymerase specialized sigma24 family protein
MAWTTLLTVYQPQVERWVRQICGPATVDIEDLVQDSITRFWRAYTAADLARARGLADVLSYWRDCVRSAALDQRRRHRINSVPEELADSYAAPRSASADGVANRVVHAAGQAQLWGCVARHCQDEADLLLAHRVFVEGRRPREVFIENPQWYARQVEVYQRLRNLKDRLRRDPEFESLLRSCLE